MSGCKVFSPLNCQLGKLMVLIELEAYQLKTGDILHDEDMIIMVYMIKPGDILGHDGSPQLHDLSFKTAAGGCKDTAPAGKLIWRLLYNDRVLRVRNGEDIVTVTISLNLRTQISIPDLMDGHRFLKV
jgi:hypothetical protein